MASEENKGILLNEVTRVTAGAWNMGARWNTVGDEMVEPKANVKGKSRNQYLIRSGIKVECTP
jgi:hypothetical protein